MTTHHHLEPAKRYQAIRESIEQQHEEAAQKQAERGKRGARERVLALLDDGSFVELDPFVQHRANSLGMEAKRPYGDGVVTGFGTIDGRKVAVFSQDFTVFGGSLGEAFAEKMVKLMDLAERYGCPIIGINDSAGARIQEGVEGLAGYGKVFFRNVRALRRGAPDLDHRRPVRGRGGLLAGDDRHYVVMVEDIGQMFITGPDVIKTVTGETVTHEELGGADTHIRVSGVAHLVAADEDDAHRPGPRSARLLPVEQPRGTAHALPGDDPKPGRIRSRPDPDGEQQAVRHARRPRARCSTTATSSSSRRLTPATS